MKKKKIYDKYGVNGLKEQNNILNQNQSSDRLLKKETINHRVNITLEDAYNGPVIPVELIVNKICNQYNGNGTKNKEKPPECKLCKKEMNEIGFIIKKIDCNKNECNNCHGSEIIVMEENRCSKCNGIRVIAHKAKENVNIKPGSNNKTKIFLIEEGNEKPNHPTGDIQVRIDIEKHNLFKRKNNDLIYNVDISLIEALTGFGRVITLLNGKNFLIKKMPNEVIKPGLAKVIQGKGMPLLDWNGKFGNLYLNFNIQFPEKLNESQKTELKYFLSILTIIKRHIQRISIKK